MSTLRRWARIRRALGLAWRRPEDCPHPERQRRLSDGGLGGDVSVDVECCDCGQLVGWFDGRGDWHDARP